MPLELLVNLLLAESMDLLAEVCSCLFSWLFLLVDPTKHQQCNGPLSEYVHSARFFPEDIIVQHDKMERYLSLKKWNVS